jgi:hypothetical protein
MTMRAIDLRAAPCGCVVLDHVAVVLECGTDECTCPALPRTRMPLPS